MRRTELGNPCNERLYERAVKALRREGAWVDAAGSDYVVRLSPDRRRRPALRLDEDLFRDLVRDPGLRPRPAGGWRLVGAASAGCSPHARPQPGRPGMAVEEVMAAPADGLTQPRRINRGESALLWLARRKDRSGRPFITGEELLAGERFRRDVETAGVIGRLTMDWRQTPPGSGQGGGLQTAERVQAAKTRVSAAVKAVGPQAAAVLERVCVAGSALRLVERELGLPARAGGRALKSALRRLVEHYGARS